jgi:proteasome lid subunit RPN8/RPN11
MSDAPSPLLPNASGNSEAPPVATCAAVSGVGGGDPMPDRGVESLEKPDQSQANPVLVEHGGAPISVPPPPSEMPPPPSEQRANKKMFVIENVSVAYQPRKGEEPYRRPDVVLESGSTRNAPYVLVIEAPARRAIFEHIGWNGVRAENNVEQGGILLGEVIETPGGRFFGIAKKALPGLGGRGSSTYLQLDHSAWKAMYDQVDELTHLDGSGNQIIGWYHTHPRNLGVFMSGVDMNTQRTMFSRPWQFAVVLNPHRHLWKVFCGADAKECPGYFLKHRSWEVVTERDTPNPDKAHQGSTIFNENRAATPCDTSQSRSIKLPPFSIQVTVTITTFCATVVVLHQYLGREVRKNRRSRD